MSATPVVAIPVKPFGDAKRRLSAVLSVSARSRLGEALAGHAVRVVAGTGASPLILSADQGVTDWAQTAGTDVLLDEGSSLDRAAGVAMDWALGRRRPWAILHADLPLLTAKDLAPLVRALEDGRAVVAPSSDGGTSFFGSSGRLRFSYGAGSFHRHLAQIAHLDPAVFTSVGLGLDLDEPVDLAAALRHPDGRWLAGIVALDTVP